MAYTFGNKCTKNLCKWIVLVQFIIENVVACFFFWDSVVGPYRWLMSVCVCVDVLSNFFKSLLFLQFFSDSHETWHTWSVCQYATQKLWNRFSKFDFKIFAEFFKFYIWTISKARGYIAYYILFLKDTYVPYCILACVNKNRIHCNYNTEFN